MLSIIVAIAENYAIGKKGDLLCHLPNDLQHFKQITSGKTVLMGERTFYSLPKHPLPNRRNIVLTDKEGKTFEGADVAYSIDELISKIDPNEEAFVIGGGMVYKQMMPLADKLYITHIHNSWSDADTFFPQIDPEIWKVSQRSDLFTDEETGYTFEFVEYEKR